MVRARTLDVSEKHPVPAVAGTHPDERTVPVTTPTTVARAVARDAERRARTALDGVLAAHDALRNADADLAAATQAKAVAEPVLARAIAVARDAGITTEHLTELGITAPTSRTLRRRRKPPSQVTVGRTPDDTQERTPNDTAGRTPEGPGGGHPVHAAVSPTANSEADTDGAHPWSPQGSHPGRDWPPAAGHHELVEAVTSW